MTSKDLTASKLELVSHDPVLMVEIEKLKVVDQPMPKLDSPAFVWLESSIKKFGIKNPIRVSLDFTIIDGRNRYAIATGLGMKMVPCVISDTESNPLEHVLKFDLELGRRSILPQDRSRLVIERDEFYKKCEEQSYEACTININPKLTDTIRRVYEETKDLQLIRKIASYPAEIQESLLTEVTVVIDDSAAENSLEEIRRLTQSEIDLKKELESTKRIYENMEKEYEDMREQFAKLQGDMKVDIDKRLKAKEKELEEKYKSSSPEGIQKLAESIRKDIDEEYKNDLYDLHGKLKEMSLLLSEKRKEQKKLKEELTALKRTKKDLELVAKNLNKKIKAHHNVIVGLARPDKFAKRLEMTFSDLNNTFTGLIESGFDGFDSYFTGHMRTTLEKIKDVTAELEKLLMKTSGNSNNDPESPEGVEVEDKCEPAEITNN